ncbi:hypothetical protein C8R43DRAFT_906876, partial [Mycena crocata]
WPNLYQHRISLFHLIDPSKSGHHKIMSFFLVDPANDNIVSATDMPPQQAEWTKQVFVNTMVNPGSASASLPPEPCECMQEYMSDGLMTHAEAETYRLELMKERTAFLVEHEKTVFQQPFDMCDTSLGQNKDFVRVHV